MVIEEAMTEKFEQKWKKLIVTLYLFFYTMPV
jgi:hypothetical protein